MININNTDRKKEDILVAKHTKIILLSVAACLCIVNIISWGQGIKTVEFNHRNVSSPSSFESRSITILSFLAGWGVDKWTWRKMLYLGCPNTEFEASEWILARPEAGQKLYYSNLWNIHTTRRGSVVARQTNSRSKSWTIASRVDRKMTTTCDFNIAFLIY